MSVLTMLAMDTYNKEQENASLTLLSSDLEIINAEVSINEYTAESLANAIDVIFSDASDEASEGLTLEDINSLDMSYSQEDDDDKQQPGMLKRIWDRIKTAIARAIASIQEFFKRIFSNTEKLKGKLEGLKKQVESSSDSIDSVREVNYKNTIVRVMDDKGNLPNANDITDGLFRDAFKKAYDLALGSAMLYYTTVESKMRELTTNDEGVIKNAFIAIAEKVGKALSLVSNASNIKGTKFGGYVISSDPVTRAFDKVVLSISIETIDSFGWTSGGAKPRLQEKLRGNTTTYRSRDLVNMLDAAIDVVDLMDDTEKQIDTIVFKRKSAVDQIDKLNYDRFGAKAARLISSVSMRLVQADHLASVRQIKRISFAVVNAVADIADAHIKASSKSSD